MKIKFLVLFFLLAFSLTIPAQQTGLVAFDVLVTKLERTHHVKLYYKSVWFEDKLFKETMAEMTLENALTIIKRSVHLNCIQMLSDSYVFVPEEVRNYSNWLLHQMPEADLKNSSVNFYDFNALLNIKFNPKNKLVLFGYLSDEKYSLSNENKFHYENLLGSVQYTHLTVF